MLVVDDYRTMRRILRNLLAEIGFVNVEEAEDGRSALRMLHERRYDLVISDWNMTPMSGLDLLRLVRWDDELKHVPFIMITAVNTAENVAAAKAEGVSGYIVKPFTAATLQKRIDSVLGPR